MRRQHCGALGFGLDAPAIDLPRIERRVRHLGHCLREARAEIGADAHDLGESKCGIVTFEMKDLSAMEIKAALLGNGCNVSVADPIEARLDLGRRGLPALVRASLYYFNSEQEIEQTCAALARLRGPSAVARAR